MRMTRPSLPLLLSILVPVLGGVLMFILVVVAFEAARGVALEEQEQAIEELVDLTASSIERLWVAPRDKTVQALATSERLQRRLKGEATFEELAREWATTSEMLEGYFFIYYGLRDGTIEYYPDGALPEDYDPRERPWYKAGMRSDGEPAWTTPYAEAITGDMVVSTVAPIYRDERKVGVMSIDITFDGLEAILEQVRLPPGSSIFLLDHDGRPFIGTNEEYIGRERLPEGGAASFVESSAPMSNGWRVTVRVPRTAMAESFAELRRPIVLTSAAILLIGAAIVAALGIRTAWRTSRLAGYFRQSLEQASPLRQLFRTRDEFSFLNHHFNRALEKARGAEEEKLDRERAFRFLVEQAPVGFFRTNRDGALLYINPHCAEMLGYTRREAQEELASVLALYEDSEDRKRFLTDLREHGEVRNRKMQFRKKTGETIWISMTAHIDTTGDGPGEPSPGGPGRPDGFEIEGFLIDVTQEMEERHSLESIAHSDGLTGAANRRAFDRAADAVATRARATGRPVALIIFDLDRFKSINDSWGHDVGDRLLQSVVRTGEQQIRGQDIFARIGGDEFAILLPDSDREAAYTLAERLRDAIRATPAPEPLTEAPTLSIGISVLEGTHVQIPELLKRADTAMYQAKQAGRGQVACDPESA